MAYFTSTSYTEGRGYSHRSSDQHSRQQRLDQGSVIDGFHQTDASAARSILSSDEMYPGSGGLAGGGIYFATSAELTEYKAQHKGVVLRARVQLGRVKTLGPSGDHSMTGSRLLAEGYDSVKIMRSAGTEYVVYSSDQVSQIRQVGSDSSDDSLRYAILQRMQGLEFKLQSLSRQSIDMGQSRLHKAFQDTILRLRQKASVVKSKSSFTQSDYQKFDSKYDEIQELVDTLETSMMIQQFQSF